MVYSTVLNVIGKATGTSKLERWDIALNEMIMSRKIIKPFSI